MKKIVYQIFMAILMVFAMMPMMAGTVFAGGDTEAPVFDASTIELELPEGKTEVTAGDSVKFSVKVTDATGINLAEVYYQLPVSGRKECRLSYNPETDRYETEFTISNAAQAGEWTIAYFWGRDNENNNGTQYPAYEGEFAAGTFTVVGTTTDTEPPVFDASTIELELPEGKTEVTAGDSVKFSVKVTDATGINLAEVYYQLPVSGRKECRLSYNPETDRYETVITITKGAQAGEWTIAYFWGRDNENNNGTQYPAYEGEFAAGTFTVRNCEVVFNSCGGSAVATQYIVPGEKAAEPGAPSKEGFDFSGWFRDEDLTELFDFDTAVNSDTTLYAKWVRSFTPADMTPPEFDLSTLKAEISSGAETATVGDTVTVSVRITDDIAVRRASIIINRPTGGIFNHDMEYNPDSDCFEFVILITESTVPGEYTINQITAWDTNDNPVSLHYTSTDFSAGRFTVENANGDAMPPEVDLTTLKAEISSGAKTATVGDTVTVSVRITDDTAVRRASIIINRPTGGIFNHDMEYNPDSDCFEYLMPIMENTVPGEYTINQITAWDTSDNSINLHYTSTDLSAGCFTVENEDGDAIPPEIDLSTLRSEISSGAETATVGDTVTVSVRITDNTAVRRASIIINRPTGGIFNHDMEYNPDSYCFEYVIPITESTVPGEYTINQITAWDTSDNSVNLHYTSTDLSAGSFIVFGTTSDDTPPVINTGSLQLTLPEGRDFAVTGNSVKAGVAVSDEGLGVSRVTIKYNMPVSGDIESVQLTYNSETGKWEKEIGFNQSSEHGLWKIYSVEALDKGGNLARIINSEFDTDSNADLSAGDFQLRSTVTFDTRGGSYIDPQYIASGEKAARPGDPTKGGGAWKGGGDFVDWYTDKALTQEFNFNTSITEDTTVYAKWAYGFSICSYDKTNSDDYDGGKYMVLQHGATEDDLYYGGSNFTLYEGDAITLKAYPDSGYKFAGWYRGEYIGMVDNEHTQVSRPLDMSDSNNLLSSDPEYAFIIDQSTVICPVFEVCSDHQWEQHIRKATPDADGHTFRVCTVCGAEETGMPIPKVSSISLEGTSFAYTGKAIEPKVTVADVNGDLSPENYEISYANNVEAGTAIVTVTLKGDRYEGSKELTFTITKSDDSGESSEGQGGTGDNPGGTSDNPGSTGSSTTSSRKANPMKVKGKTVTIRYKKISGKTLYIKRTKAIKLSKAKGKVTYKLLSVTKKKFKKYFKVNAKNGKVIVSKGLPEGTYKVKVKVTAAGNKTYKKLSKTVKITVKVVR